MPMRKRFLDILIIELDDLEDDLIDLINLTKDRLQRHEITNYVYQGNKGVLLNELTCLRELTEALRQMDTSRYDDVGEVAAEVEEMVRRRTTDCAYPEAVFSLVKRRLDRVQAFLSEKT